MYSLQNPEDNIMNLQSPWPQQPYGQQQMHGGIQQQNSPQQYSKQQYSPQCHEPPYVPLKLRDPKAFATFNKELVNAVTCCEAVEQNPWNAPTAQDVVQKARRKKGRATVRAVSLPSDQSSCSQRFMVFEAKEDGHTTYIIAFRSDPQCYNDIVSTPAGYKDVENDNNFQVHKSMWWRAATMPLRSLPPQWRSGLRDRGHRLILTGFSVGGAVAALATLQLLEAEDDLMEQICCYTFGAPLQGDQNYADRINQMFASNFYHVMLDGDRIPGILTLLSKVAENQPDVCDSVVSSICTMLAVATGVALTVVAPGAATIAGAIAHQMDFAKLGSGIKSLIATVENSRMPLPEYKFGGTLVLLNLGNISYQMEFVRLRGDGRVLEDLFGVQERHATSPDLQCMRDIHQLKTFCQVINESDNPYLTQAIKNASIEQHNPRIFSDTPREFSQLTMVDHGLDQINEVLKDGAGRVAKSTASAAKSAARCVMQPNVEADHTSSRYLLQPQFDIEKPIQVWLDKHENITIEVYGENMAFGIHVLYLQNGKEKLRIPCTEKYSMPQLVENSKNPQKPMEQSFANLPLQFSTQGIKGLSFNEPDGRFRVYLAFGCTEVAASKVNIRIFDALDELKVAERFSTEQPSELIDLLLFWGVATTQAQCTAAFYAIQENPRDANDIVTTTLDELCNDPPEFVLMDRLLALLDTSQFPLSVLDKLPPEMSKTLRNTTNAASLSNVIVPYFSADNESAKWTFGGCFTRTIKRLITKEMLSKKETAEQLAKSLDEEFAGPKKMVLAYLDHRFEYKEYAKEFSFKHMKGWNIEKAVVKDVTNVFNIVGCVLPVVNLPILSAGQALESDFLIGLGLLIGLPTGVVAATLSGGARWLYHAVSAPVRMIQNRPGLMDDWKRVSLSADNWENKLKAAAYLFQCKIEPPHVACRLEFELYSSLKDRIPKSGCFNLSTMLVKRARYEATTALQLANYGLAGAMVYEIRRYLTERKTALGLIGSSQAGKSTFASQAFKVESHPGAGKNARTRVLRHWTLALQKSRNRQFTLIDFPGSTDHVAPHWYIRGQLLASVLVVVLSLKEINSAQAVTLVDKACKARRKDKEVSILFCFTYADVVYESYKDEAEEMGGHTTAAQLFTQNFESYKKELLDAASEAAGDADQLAYINSHMHACCFAPKLQDGTKPQARELKNVNVKNVKWVKDWCLDKLFTINMSKSHSGTFSD